MEATQDRSSDRHKNRRMVRVPDELWEALDRYRTSLPHDPGRGQIVRDALIDFLKRKGFPPQAS